MPNSVLDNLVFARAHYLNPNNLKVNGYRVFDNPESKFRSGVNGDHAFTEYPAGQLPDSYLNGFGKFSTLGSKVVEVHASRFTGYTKPAHVKPCIPVYGNIAMGANHPLAFSAFNNFELNLATGEFVKPEFYVPPRENDLICGLVTKNKSANEIPSFEKWWICSEQFFKLVFVLRIIGENSFLSKTEKNNILSEVPYFANSFKEYNPTYEKNTDISTAEENLIVTEDFNRFSNRGNNFTIGSAVNKEIWARLDNGANPMTHAELSASYIRSRCESYTRDPNCVHLYNALIRIFVFGEELTDANVPKNILGLQTLKWRIPDNFDDILKWFSS